MEMKRIAILGSTGHIAKGLIDNLAGRHELILFSRSRDHPPWMFPHYGDYDVVINCIGVGENLWNEPSRIFEMTEYADALALDYVRKHPDALLINFSSGAVFGDVYERPRLTSDAIFHLHGMGAESTAAFYGIAKLNSEAKHRSLQHLNIADLRVFSYVSRYLRPECPCLMNEILAAVRAGRELATSPVDFYRDYVHPKDLAQLVQHCMDLRHLNYALDVYSLLPARKFEMLDHFKNVYGLHYRVEPAFPETSPTGMKKNYYSANIAAADIGYVPQYTAMDAVREAAKALLGVNA